MLRFVVGRLNTNVCLQDRAACDIDLSFVWMLDYSELIAFVQPQTQQILYPYPSALNIFIL